MDPVYRNMHSYPYQSDQIHYSPHFYPGTEPIPPQMHMNPTRPPLNYGCWPWGINYGYASPIPCHGCCNNPYSTNPYTFGSPYFRYPPQPHCPASYPSFPVQYIPPPPPCYPMEQSRYEYEKNLPMGSQHCCGCRNHKSHQKEQQRDVRIEEEELPDGERRKNVSLSPLQLKNLTHPILLMPSDYNNNEHGNDSHGNSVVKKDGVKNGWYPLDLNDLVSSKKHTTGAEERTQQEDNGDGKGHSPFPLFWVPYSTGEKEKEKEVEKCNLNDSNIKQCLESEKGSLGEKNIHSIGEDIGRKDGCRVKDIQVKEVGKREEKEKEGDAPVKDNIDHGERKVDNGNSKLSKESVKRKSTSPPKSSKLPPVCLRVDPLPRRKTANERLRSPSPPGDGQKSDFLSGDVKSKSFNSSDGKELDKSSTNEFKEGKATKTVKVVDGETWQEKNMDVNVESRVNKPEENISRECVETDAVKGQSDQGKNEELLREKHGRGEEVKRTINRNLSEEEAAINIQSAYRGFDIRRWEPIKKLKEIAKVREQITNVNQMIQQIESTSDIHGTGKQRNVISETIMSLLLKLDTIQGLHPSIRDVRKSVVKELVSLQEKLDLLVNRKSGDSPQHESNSGCPEDVTNKIEDATPSQNGSEMPSDLPDENQPDRILNCGKSGISETNSEGGESTDKLEKEDQKNMKNKEDNCSGLENDQISTAKDDDHEDLVVEHSLEIPVLHDPTENVTDFAPPDSDELDIELAEFFQELYDGLYDRKSRDQKTVDPDAKEGQIDEEMPISMELRSDTVNIETGEDKFDLEGCVDQSPQNVTAGIFERSPGDKGFPIPDACNEIKADMLKLGKAIDNPPEKGMPGQLLCSEQDAIGMKNMAEEEFENGTPDCVENLEDFENANGDDMLSERNRKLVEENERLRGILENLITSGQERLTAISTLTGKVKDLERKLSKKKKLKMKTRKSKKMSTLVVPDDE